MTKDDWEKGTCKVCFNLEEGKEIKIRNKIFILLVVKD